jgi:YesN/AraC family two-component response regulator
MSDVVVVEKENGVLFGVRADRPASAAPTVQKALTYIERNLNKRVTLDDAADYADISACYLSRMFRRTLNINFVTYLTARRMELAKEMLAQTERSITDVAREFSYSDLNYFCKSFKKQFGMPPSEYRRQHAKPGAKRIARRSPSPAGLEHVDRADPHAPSLRS